MPNQCERNCGLLAAVLKVAMVLVLVLAAAGPAAAQTIYNNIPSPLTGNVPSLGLEAAAVAEFGDGLVFTAGAPQKLVSVKVIMSDWACTSGNWFNAVGTPNPCVTAPAGATFSQPIALNIYAVNPGSPPTPGALLATKMTTFNVPYRPSSDAVHCGAGAETWYSAQDNQCYFGFAFPITFDFSADGVVLPNQVIVTASYNTTHYGPNPVGPGAACFSTIQGCPYDSLNIGAAGSVPSTGKSLDPNGVFITYAFSNLGCVTPNPTGILFDDTAPGCWTVNHPLFQIVATSADILQIGYAANLNAGDSIVDFTSAGAIGGTDPAGDICANIYVFDDLQEMIACCSCPLTPNHLTGASVKKDLISNLLTPGSPPAAVTIAVTASISSSCNAAQVVSYAPGLRAWGTTLHAKPGGGFASTERPFLIASPSNSELTKLTSYCGFIQASGSGHGICDSCSPGAAGGGGGGGGGGPQGPPQ